MVQVGRVPLLLLDTDTPLNDEADRPITHTLYVRGREMRLHQELVLGVGGVRALRALGIAPAAWHLNEGHSAFLLVERARELVADGVPFEEALEQVRARSVFTIHTPVSAGNERFDADLVRTLAAPMMQDSGVDMERVLELGRGVDDDHSQFDMTGFSLRLSVRANAVSQLHAETANGTWHQIIRRPILGITNGVHPGTWLGGPDPGASTRGWVRTWTRSTTSDPRTASGSACRASRTSACGTPTWSRSWSWRCSRVVDCGRSWRVTANRPSELHDVEAFLDPSILTIGFARRFATYKRAALLFSDEERLARLLWDTERPVQIVFAGKAHPADRPGQRVIQDIFSRSRSKRLKGRVVILEDYDIRVGPLPGPGRRRVAQQPAPTARGVGHERHEGGHERGRQLLRPGRLVGRGLDRGQRLGHRRPRDEPRRGRPGLGRRAGAVPPARDGHRAPLVRP